jgi:hypothetical protein
MNLTRDVRYMDRKNIQDANYLRAIVRADNRLLPVDSALGEHARNRLGRGGAAVQLVLLPAGAGEGCVGAGVVAYAYIGGDAIACEVAIVSRVRMVVAFG